MVSFDFLKKKIKNDNIPNYNVENNFSNTNNNPNNDSNLRESDYRSFQYSQQQIKESTQVRQQDSVIETRENPRHREIDILTELPEFPTMEFDKGIPLPELESEDLANKEPEMPNIDFDSMRKQQFSEKSKKDLTKSDDKSKDKEKSKEREKKREDILDISKLDITKEIFGETQEIKENENIFSISKSCFINVRDYREITKEIKIITTMIDDSMLVKLRIDNIKERENEEIKNLYSSLEGLNKIFLIIDDILGRNER